MPQDEYSETLFLKYGAEEICWRTCNDSFKV